MARFFRKYWFLLGLLAVALLTLSDGSETVAGAGRWLGSHKGTEMVICLIFFLSGMSLATEDLKRGISDVRTTLLTIWVIFVMAPLLGSAMGLLPLTPGMRIGLYIVAVMPTTLSSGVVMTGAAGGNMANALMITIIANALGVFTIPLSLHLLLGLGNGASAFHVDKAALMLKIASLVLVPLVLGLMIRRRLLPCFHRLGLDLSILNQLFILTIVWIAISRSRNTIVGSLPMLGEVVLLVFSFHALLLIVTFLAAHMSHLGVGRREALIFMGGQKTLPLSVLIQVSLFPQVGAALVICVVHHVIHLLMDGYLVARLAHAGRREVPTPAGQEAGMD